MFSSRYLAMKRSLVVLSLLFLLSTPVLAERISCTFDVNDVKQSIDIAPKNDIYAIRKIDLPGGFRFAGQYIPELGKFKAYIYHTPKERFVLLALQDFKSTPQTCPQDFGQHRVYDSADERELFFHCIKTCQR